MKLICTKLAWENNGSKLLIYRHLSLLFFFVFKYILSLIPLLCTLFVNSCESICYEFGVLRNHPCVLQMCYQKALMCYQNREVEILNDHNDRDLNDRK